MAEHQKQVKAMTCSSKICKEFAGLKGGGRKGMGAVDMMAKYAMIMS